MHGWVLPKGCKATIGTGLNPAPCQVNNLTPPIYSKPLFAHYAGELLQPPGHQCRMLNEVGGGVNDTRYKHLGQDGFLMLMTSPIVLALSSGIESFILRKTSTWTKLIKLARLQRRHLMRMPRVGGLKQQDTWSGGHHHLCSQFLSVNSLLVTLNILAMSMSWWCGPCQLPQHRCILICNVTALMSLCK